MKGSRKYILCITFFVFFFAAEVYCQNEWDIFVFSLNWPYTGCYTVKSKNPNKNCNIPSPIRWTIHGLWPSKFGTFGPQDCDKSLKFNVQNVASIQDQLNNEWMANDASKPNKKFWQWEWEKHGTCSVDILDQAKYFSKGLELQQTYNVGEILGKADIQPGGSYNVQTYLDALSQGLGKHAFVSCLRNQQTSEIYLHEIRICFDKQLQLADCDGIYSFPTNCNKRKDILYPNEVPGL